MSEKFVFDGTEYTLPSPDGMTFESVAGAYQLCVRDEMPIYDHGVRTGTLKALVAEFGDMKSPAVHDSETGDDYYQIRGHFVNTLEQGRQKGWSDEERALVEKKLLVTQAPGDHWLHSKPPAGRPWPTYDDTAAAGIAQLASQLGLVEAAVAYERENKARKTVLEALANLAPVEEEIAVV